MPDCDAGKESICSDRWAWRSALHRLWWTFLGCIMLAVIVGILSPRGKEDAKCPDVTHIKIAVGLTTYSVPRNYDFNVSEGEIPPNFHIREYCPDDDSSVLKVENLVFQSAHNYSSDDYKSASIAGVQIRVRDRSLSRRKPKDSFEFHVGQLRKKGLTPATLKRKHDFHAYEVERGTNLYFALGHANAIENVPLIITCGSPAVIFGGNNIGRSCRTGYYALSEDLVVSYWFRDAGHGIETWINLNKRVREFVRSFEVGDARN